MHIVTQVNDFFNKTVQRMPKQTRKLYEFGFKAISIQPLESLNANARCTVKNQHTAQSKMYRLSHNNKFLKCMPALLTTLNLVNKNDFINVDFSDFKDRRQVLMFAKQTMQGRALPLYFDELKYPIREGSQNIFIWTTILSFLKLIEFKVRFVFDRGFALPYLIQNLTENGHIFYIRIKKSKLAQDLNNQKLSPVKELAENDSQVLIYERKLRVVRSDQNNEDNEPWFIVTNDFESDRSEIISIYYHRFEVEELFKDAKHFFRMEHMAIKTEKTLKIVLWFVVLGMWLSWFLQNTLGAGVRLMKKYKDKFSISIVKYWLERVAREIRSYALDKISEYAGI